MIKLGIRRNLLYPSLFIVFTASRKVFKFILDNIIAKNIKCSFLMISLMVLMEFILGLYFSLKQQKDIKSFNINNNTNENENKLVFKRNSLKRLDSDFIIILLMVFSAYFEIIGFLSRRLITIFDHNTDDYDEFNAKFRSAETIVSSILCSLTLKMNIYRHQVLSLIIIAIVLILIFILQLEEEKNDIDSYLIKIAEVLGTSICRAFLDTTEKYLIEYNHLDIFKLIRFQSLINIFVMSSFYIFDMPRKEIVNLYHSGIETFLLALLFLLIYGILSGFKNIYRRYTVKEYSPMSRALSESLLDPLFIIIGAFLKNNNNIPYLIFVFILAIIIIFCNCVYNEVFIVYCCGLEKNTFLEIRKRGEIEKLSMQFLEQ